DRDPPAVGRDGDRLDPAALLAPRRPPERPRLARLGLQPGRRVRPDADDLVVAGGQEEPAVRAEPQHVAGAEPAAGLDHDLGLVAGPAVVLLGGGGWGEGRDGEEREEAREHGGPGW